MSSLRKGTDSSPESLQNQVDALKEVVTAPLQPPFTVDRHDPLVQTPSTPATGVLPATITPVARHPPNASAAVADLMTLPHSYFVTLAELWFKEDASWLPILDYDHIQNSLAALPQPVNHIPDVVLRAVITLKLTYSSQAISLGYNGRRRLSAHLRSEVLSEAMSTPSLSSIRAMFIIAFLDYGSDNIPSTLNIMSMCRRTGEHIGIFRQLLQRIEAQSPQQVGPPSRDNFASDDSQIAQTWGILSFDAVSSLGVSWRDTSAALATHLSGIAYVSAPNFRDSFVTHVHLASIGLQPVHEFFFEYANGAHQILEDQTLTVTEDMYQNLMSYVHGLPASGYTILEDGAVDFEINHVFTRLLSNAATIMIYQRYALNENDSNRQLAQDRCMESYDQLKELVRNISDADAEINSPMFAFHIASAVRFRLVLEKHDGKKREPGFDILLHGINMCGRRWLLARRLELVFKAALVELDSGVSAGLPEDFWDLKKSAHDISEALKTWMSGYKPSLWVHIGSLNNPYV